MLEPPSARLTTAARSGGAARCRDRKAKAGADRESGQACSAANAQVREEKVVGAPGAVEGPRGEAGRPEEETGQHDVACQVGRDAPPAIVAVAAEACAVK